jgi:lipid-binding SYLF domain-containing protein
MTIKAQFFGCLTATSLIVGMAAAHAAQPDGSVLPPPEPPASCLGLSECKPPPAPSADDWRTRLPPYPLPSRIYGDSARARGSAEAEGVLEQVYAMPEADRRFLLSRLDDARGFAIFPEVRKSGVMAATVYGRGIMAFRDDFWEWTTPILLSMQGRSVGPQVSADRTTVIFIFDRICSVRDFLTAHHHISSTPQGTVITHIGHAEPHDPMGISVHVLQRGMSMGQSIDSYSIHIDEAGNAALYGIDFSPACLVQGVSASPKLPWMIKFFERMALPPGIPERTIDIR